MRTWRQAWRCFRGRHIPIREVGVITRYRQQDEGKWLVTSETWDRTYCGACEVDLKDDGK